MVTIISVQSKNFLMKFLEPTRKPKVIYTDNSLEFGNVVKNYLGIIVRQRHKKSETNGIAERTVRRVKEGISAVLLQSGLDEKWWADSMECCYLRNIQDLLCDRKTPYERWFGIPFHNGPVIPFGAMVEYHPISAKDISRVHQFGPKSLARDILRLCIVRGGNLERRRCERRH